MKKISIMILVLVVALASCKKTPEVNLKYVDVERDLITVGITTATVQCDYQYIATLKKAYFCYGEGENEDNFSSAEMRVVQNTLYVELTGLGENTTYNYFYEFHNGFNSMRTALKSFKTETSPGGVTLPTVITAAVTEITTNSAKGGGEVTDDGGAEVTERGICWSTNANPTINNSHIAAGSGMGAFTAVMSDLEANTTYHVRAYAINEAGTAYGLDREFVTSGGGGGSGIPEGAIDGLFSVSPTQKVYISKGNLQYQASTNTWRFAENQWDFVGSHYAEGDFGTVYENSIKCDNSLVSETYSGWIDLFGWGTSGWDNGNVYYHPYDSYTPQFGVEEPKELYGPPGDYDLIGDYSFSDWGVYNPINNGGNQLGLWRTLLEQEWEYLMMHRENAYEKHFSATVCNTLGCVILPDDWTCPLGVSYEIINYNWEENIFTQEEWWLMEKNGAVFFPVTCHRFADFSYYLCNCGYQTASRWTNDAGRNTVFIYNKGYGYVQNVGVLRCDPYSVRLVQDANPQNKEK